MATEVDATTKARVRILVVDDSAISRAHVLSTLEKLAHAEATAVESGTQALRALRDGGYSLILCDYEMPDMSGLQLLRFVRAKYSALELPLLLLTGSDDPDIKVRAFRAGANDYIAKQAAPEELLARVGTQIELLAGQRRLVQAQLRRAEGQKFEAIGQLTEALAHELNTPAQYLGDNLAFLQESFESLRGVIERVRQRDGTLTAAELVAMIETLDCDYLFAEIPRCIEESQQGVAQVSRIVSVMREFARRGVQQAVPHDLNEIVKGAVAVTRGQWHQVAELALELDATLPQVSCVGSAIKQVVLYAIMNAVKAMASADGIQRTRDQLRIRTSHDERWATIEISDTGRAIASELITQLLDPVLGGAASNDAAQALAQVHAVIVSEHHGKLDISSAPQTGTSIAMRLPHA
jgi:two-component system NtrC family sensor kinase